MTAHIDTWAAIQAFMHQRCGVVLGEDQRYLMEARLSGVARSFQARSIEDFVKQACASTAPLNYVNALIDAMTTHETSFFRDPNFWQYLEHTILHKLVQRNSLGPLRIWVPACSTGQEVYSLAMLLYETWPSVYEQSQIFASDVSELSVNRAKQGKYSVLELNRGTSAIRLVRHFQQLPGGYQIRHKLQERIQWSTHNLLGTGFEPIHCDLVFCRNVLIYFQPSDQRLVKQRLLRALAPHGYLGLGNTETVEELASPTPGWFHRP